MSPTAVSVGRPNTRLFDAYALILVRTEVKSPLSTGIRTTTSSAAALPLVAVATTSANRLAVVVNLRSAEVGHRPPVIGHRVVASALPRRVLVRHHKATPGMLGFLASMC